MHIFERALNAVKAEYVAGSAEEVWCHLTGNKLTAQSAPSIYRLYDLKERRNAINEK